MKKIVLFIYIICIVFVFMSCKNKEKQQEVENTNVVTPKEAYSTVYKEFKTEYDIENEFSKLTNVTVLSAQDKMTEEIAKEKYNLSKYDGITFSVWSKIDQFSIDEIAIIKLKDTDQNYDILKDSIGKRLNDLKNEYSYNDKIVDMLDTKYSIEQNKGVIILVIGENSNEIMKILTEDLKAE